MQVEGRRATRRLAVVISPGRTLLGVTIVVAVSLAIFVLLLREAVNSSTY